MRARSIHRVYLLPPTYDGMAYGLIGGFRILIDCPTMCIFPRVQPPPSVFMDMLRLYFENDGYTNKVATDRIQDMYEM